MVKYCPIMPEMVLKGNPWAKNIQISLNGHKLFSKVLKSPQWSSMVPNGIKELTINSIGWPL